MFKAISSTSRLGLPVPVPITWEDYVANEMSTIPWWELNAGGVVEDLYKAYQAGIHSGAIVPWTGSDPEDKTVGYLSDNTGYHADECRDFLDTMVRVVAQGNAPADVVQGTGPLTTETGTVIDAAKSGLMDISTTVTSGLSGVLVPLSIVAGVGLFFYLMSTGIIPKPKSSDA